MKKQFTTITILIIAVLLFTAAVNAQSRGMMKMNIPFEFYVGGDLYESGEYLIERLNPRKPSILILKNTEGEDKKILLTQAVGLKGTMNDARVIFSKYEDSYFLSEIWMPNSENGLQLLKSKSEQEIETTMKTELEEIEVRASK